MAYKQNKIQVVAGFNTFLEHLLSYEGKEEKGSIGSRPVVQLGGGAFNILKTLETLGVSESDLTLCTTFEQKESAQGKSLEFLLAQERFSKVLLPVMERVFSSYYLLPTKGAGWAFGDRRMRVSTPSTSDLSKVRKIAKSATIKIVAEPLTNPASMRLAKELLQRYTKNQHSVLIPSSDLLKSPSFKRLLPHITLLSCNKKEVAQVVGRGDGTAALLRSRIPYIFITNGAKEALLKVGEQIYTATPKKVSNPQFVGGAGDAATAALIFELFIRGASPEQALQRALAVGTEVLGHPTSYLP